MPSRGLRNLPPQRDLAQAGVQIGFLNHPPSGTVIGPGGPAVGCDRHAQVPRCSIRIRGIGVKPNNEHLQRGPSNGRSQAGVGWQDGVLVTLNVVFALCLLFASLDAGPGWSGSVDRDSGGEFGEGDTGDNSGGSDSGIFDGDSGFVIDPEEYFETRSDTGWNGWCVKKDNARGYSCTDGNEWAEVAEAEVRTQSLSCSTGGSELFPGPATWGALWLMTCVVWSARRTGGE